MAKQQTSKQPKTAAKVDTDEVKKPARTGERQPRRRHPRARSGSTVVQTDSAAVAAAAVPEADAENSAASTTNDKMPAPAASQSEPVSQGTDGATASTSGADRPPASTKRAMLIAMLERAQGASVAEIGQRLGWLPHTVRAAITGLRHAGREVTRNKDQSGQSVYRLAPVETPDR
jgi:biotin operon repressor